MTVLPFNIMCDICGEKITEKQTFIEFRTHLGILFGEDCHCHKGYCGDSLRASQKSKDWRDLPSGPLRTFFEQASEQ